MAVEIPVVIDIEKAFDDAAKRVDTAMRPFMQKIDKNTADLKLKIGVEIDESGLSIDKFESLSNIITKVTKNMKTGTTSMKYGIEELSTALEYTKERLAQLNAVQENGGTVNPTTLRSYREAVSVLTTVIEQRTHEASLIQRSTEQQIAALRAEEARRNVLNQEVSTISQMSEKISALRGQLQNLNPKSKEWSAAAKEIIKATEALGKYEAKLATATTKSGSINRMTAELSALEQKWAVMSRTQKFDKNGEFTASAQRMINKFKELSQNAERYGQSLSQIARGTDGVRATNTALRAQGPILQSLTAYASSYVSVFGLLRFAKQIRDVTGELEYQRVALGHLLQDEEYGAQLFNRIKNLAIESPFRIQQLVTYTKQLAAYRIEQESLYDTTKMLADISAGLGVDMNRLILAYGQVRAASVLRGQELRQFTEAGLPLVEQLAEKFTELKGEMVSTADVFELISKRAVPFSMISDIFEEMTEAGGMFYNMQARQAETLKGRWEKLKDAFDIGLQSIGESKGLLNFNTYMNATLKTLNFFANNLRLIPKIMEGATAAFVLFNTALWITGKRVKAYVSAENQAIVTQRLANMGVKEGAWNHKALTAALLAEQTATNALTRSFARLRIAILSNPWVAIGAAVAGIVLSFVSFRKNVDDTVSSINEYEQSIERMTKANKKAEKETKLIDRYERLASLTSRTAKENAKLVTTIDQLRTAFPSLANVINDTNTALDEQIRLLRETSGAALESAREKAQSYLEVAEHDLAEAEGKMEDLNKNYSDLMSKWREAKRRKEMGASGVNEEIKNSIEDITSEEGAEEYARRMVTQKELDKEFKKIDDEVHKVQSDFDEIQKNAEELPNTIARLTAVLHPETADKDLAEWQKQVKKLQEGMLEVGDTPLFTGEDIENMSSIYELGKKLESKIRELGGELSGARAMFANMTAGEGRDSVAKNIASMEKALAIAKAIEKFFGFNFSSNDNGYTADPFIAQRQNWEKFMQDFKKGYDSLQKYMSKDAALSQTAQTMLTRGLAMGLSEDEQKRAAEDMSKWYSDAIDEAFKQAQTHGAKGSVSDFLSQQIAGSDAQSKALRDFQKLIQSLWDSKTTLDTTKLTKDFDAAFSEMKENLKRSETVRKFYEDLLESTNDEEFATSMTIAVYGDIGQDFKERIQAQLNAAFSSLSVKTPEMKKAIEQQDFGYILDNIEQFPTEWRTLLRDMASESESYYANVATTYSKLLQKFQGIAYQRVAIERQAAESIKTIDEGLAREIESIRKGGANQATQTQLIVAATSRATDAKDAIRRQEKADLEKLSDDYQRFFNSVGVLSRKNARAVAKSAKQIVTKQFEEGEISLTKFRSELNKIDEQLAKYENNKSPLATYLESGLDGLVDKLSEYSDGLTAISGGIDKSKGADVNFNEDTKNYINKLGKIFGNGIFGLEGKGDAFELMKETYGNNMEKYAESIDKATDNLSKLNSKAAVTLGWVEFWVQLAGGAVRTFDEIAQASKKSNGEIREGWNKLAQTIFGSVTFGIGSKTWGYDSWERLSQMNEEAMSGFEKLKKGDIVGALVDVVQSWTYVFGKNINGINRDIEAQEDILHNLEKEYDRLEDSIQNAFGSEYIYNYNEQMENLRAQEEAYRKQAELEESKGKKKDEDKVNEYLESADEIAYKIKQAESQLAEFFAGTDLTSAATDFAQAWIDAYQQFSSTSTAMKEKFKEMIDNMVINSLAAAVMQKLLEPVFDKINELAKDGDLSVQDIGEISAMTGAVTEQIDSAMTSLMQSLAKAGINMRSTGSSLSGISKDIAGASEQSINGLAAGINTQNFYMSYMPTISADVAAIRAALVGATTQTSSIQASPAAVSQFGDETFRGQMLRIDENLAEIKNMVRSVITPKAANTNTHCIGTK